MPRPVSKVSSRLSAHAQWKQVRRHLVAFQHCQVSQLQVMRENCQLQLWLLVWVTWKATLGCRKMGLDSWRGRWPHCSQSSDQRRICLIRALSGRSQRSRKASGRPRAASPSLSLHSQISHTQDTPSQGLSHLIAVWSSSLRSSTCPNPLHSHGSTIKVYLGLTMIVCD